MNISSQTINYQNNSQARTAPSFTAIKKSTYKLFNDTGEAIIYQLEKSDIPMLENFINNIEKFYEKHEIKDKNRQIILLKTFQAGLDFLKNGEKEKKVKVLMAMHNNEPCGIIIGNALKVNKNGTFNYSSRKNCGKNETELDFLVTWNNRLKGIGKALLNEYFIGTKKDGFKNVYVRSEVPQYSNAITFYSKNGFRELTGQRQQLDLKKGDRSYVGGDYFSAENLVLPMKATSDSISSFIKSTSKQMERREEKLPARQTFLTAFIPTDKSIT